MSPLPNPLPPLNLGLEFWPNARSARSWSFDAQQRVIGVLSERDVVRALAERGASALTEPLARVMTRKVSTCTQSETVKSIMKQMTVCKFRHVPVVEQERLVAIVSIGDVVKHTLMEMRQESEALHDYIRTA
jgi:predicted transcriptional regulator